MTDARAEHEAEGLVERLRKAVQPLLDKLAEQEREEPSGHDAYVQIGAVFFKDVATALFAALSEVAAPPMCDECSGTGQVRDVVDEETRHVGLVGCPYCDGRGYLPTHPEKTREFPEPREGMVMVCDAQGRYLGCMGEERWRRLLADDASADQRAIDSHTWHPARGKERLGP